MSALPTPISELLRTCQQENDRYEKLQSAYLEKLKQYRFKGLKKIASLTEDEEFCIAHYIGTAYAWLNHDLRNEIPFPTTCKASFSRNLDLCLEKLSPYSGIVYRMDDPYGTVDQIFEWFEYHAGMSIQVPAYLSTSKDKWDHKPIVWRVQTLQKDSHARDISMIGTIEQEVLFKRDSQFIITGVDHLQKEICLEEISITAPDIKLVRDYVTKRFR